MFGSAQIKFHIEKQSARRRVYLFYQRSRTWQEGVSDSKDHDDYKMFNSENVVQVSTESRKKGYSLVQTYVCTYVSGRGQVECTLNRY